MAQERIQVAYQRARACEHRAHVEFEQINKTIGAEASATQRRVLAFVHKKWEIASAEVNRLARKIASE